jgi:hypothetical protein
MTIVPSEQTAKPCCALCRHWLRVKQSAIVGRCRAGERGNLITNQDFWCPLFVPPLRPTAA